MEQNSLRLTRLVLRNFRSIGHCDIALDRLTFLVGPNAAGKSNVVDALRFVTEALTGSLEQALRARGGISEVRRRSGGHPTHFGLRLEFLLNGEQGHYAFEVGAVRDSGVEVLTEQCSVAGRGKGPFYRISRGKVEATSEGAFPALTDDRLALVAASGLAAFRPVFDLLSHIGVYNLNPGLMRTLQPAQEGHLLRPQGENVAAVIGHLQRFDSESLETIEDYLRTVVPGIVDVRRIPVGPMETLEFRQTVPGQRSPWRFNALSMSDGTLRALGILAALYQSGRRRPPTLVAIEEPETALHPEAAAAIRDALIQASAHTQVIVTSHSPELLEDSSIHLNDILAVYSINGETRVAPIDPASREAISGNLFTAGELLRMGQLQPDQAAIGEQNLRQGSLFDGAIIP